MPKEDNYESEMLNFEREHEFKKYQESGSKDDFQTWKIKKYVDGRITWVYIVIGLVTLYLLAKH